MLGSYVKRPILPIFQPPIFSPAVHSQTEIGNPQPLMKGCVSPQQIVPLYFIDLPLSLAIVVLATHCFYSLNQPNLAV